MHAHERLLHEILRAVRDRGAREHPDRELPDRAVMLLDERAERSRVAALRAPERHLVEIARTPPGNSRGHHRSLHPGPGSQVPGDSPPTT